MERFNRCFVVSPTGCWLWQTCIKNNGYASFYLNGRTDYAHRAAWKLFYGAIPDGLFVCHHCDVRHCANPAHLFLGTQKDNLADMKAKGRMVVPSHSGEKNGMYGRTHSDESKRKMAEKAARFFGSSHARATIDENDVRTIRALRAQGHTCKAIALLVDTTVHVVNGIVRGRNWRSVT